MSDRTVLKIARRIVEISGEQELDAEAVQGMSFLSFVWYAWLTGGELYPEQIWATKHGPAVGDLLSVCADHQTASLSRIDDALDEWGFSKEIDDPNIEKLVEGVFDRYAHLGVDELRAIVQKEVVWSAAWGARGDASRALMNSDKVVDYYFGDVSSVSGLMGNSETPVVQWGPYPVFVTEGDDTPGQSACKRPRSGSTVPMRFRR